MPYITPVISCIYIPNRSNLNVLNEYFDFIENIINKYLNAELLLLADYNTPSVYFSNANFYFNDKLSYLHVFNIVRN